MFVLLLVFSSPSMGGLEVVPAVVKRDSDLRQGPSLRASVIKKVPKGTHLGVLLPARQGLVAVVSPSSKTPSVQGWIAIRDLAKAPRDPRHVASATATSTTSVEKAVQPSGSSHTFGISESMAVLNPSGFSNSAGGDAKSAMGFALGIHYTYRFDQRFALSGSFSYLDMAGDWALTSYGLRGEFAYYLFSSPNLVVGPMVGVGAALSDFTSPLFIDPLNLSQTSRIKTTRILSFPISAGVEARLRVYEGLGLVADAGYEINSLGELPYARDNTDTLSSAAFSANAIFVRLGATYAFE